MLRSIENDNLIIEKLKTNPNVLGIFGYSFLDENRDVVKGSFGRRCIQSLNLLAI